MLEKHIEKGVGDWGQSKEISGVTLSAAGGNGPFVDAKMHWERA